MTTKKAQTAAKKPTISVPESPDAGITVTPGQGLSPAEAAAQVEMTYMQIIDEMDRPGRQGGTWYSLKPESEEWRTLDERFPPGSVFRGKDWSGQRKFMFYRAGRRSDEEAKGHAARMIAMGCWFHAPKHVRCVGYEHCASDDIYLYAPARARDIMSRRRDAVRQRMGRAIDDKFNLKGVPHIGEGQVQVFGSAGRMARGNEAGELAEARRKARAEAGL